MRPVLANTTQQSLSVLHSAVERIEALAYAEDGYEVTKQKVESIFWQSVEMLERNPELQAITASQSGFDRYIKPLVDVTLVYFIHHKRAYENVPYLTFARKASMERALWTNYADLSFELAKIYAQIGFYSQCESLYQTTQELLYQRESLANLKQTQSNEQLIHKRLMLTLFEMRLTCHISNPQKSKRYVNEWRSNWEVIKSLYRNNSALPFVFPAMREAELDVLRQYQITDKGIFTHLPLNVSLLNSLFEYLYLVNDEETLEPVTKTLLKWLQRNSKTPHPEYSSEAAEKLILTASSPLSRQLTRSRAQRVSELSRYLNNIVIVKRLFALGSYQRAAEKAREAMIQLNTKEYGVGQLDGEFVVDYFRLNPVSPLVEGLFNGISWAMGEGPDIDGSISSDRLYVDKLELLYVYALSQERTGDYTKALLNYEMGIRAAELSRDAIPLKLRRQFFQSMVKRSYLGAYRASAKRLASDLNNAQYLADFLKSGERMRSRQLREELGLGSDDDSLKVYDIKPRAGEAVFISSDVETELIFFLKTTDTVRLSVIDKPDNWDREILELRNRIAGKQDISDTLLQQYGNQILGEFSGSLETVDRLTVLVDGVLSYVPLGVFPMKSRVPLGIHRSIQRAISLDQIDYTQPYSDIFSKRLVAVADPVYQSQAMNALPKSLAVVLDEKRTRSLAGYFTPLPETRDEVEAIAQLFETRSTLLLGDRATETQLGHQNFSDVNVVHFATHGILGGELDNVNEPALVLSADSASDGIFLASEVSRLNLDVELAVLSACNTGNGEYYFGEGVQGMARAFSIAGARHVLVSLWPVDSNTTKELMIAFYRHLKLVKQLDLALNLAQKDVFYGNNQNIGFNRGLKAVRKDDHYSTGNHSFYWAPFVLIKVK